MTEAQLTEWIRHDEGQQGIDVLPERLKRAKEFGSSSMFGESFEDVASCNCDGESIETCIEKYMTIKNPLPLFQDKDTAIDWMEDQVDDPYTDNIRFAFLDDEIAMREYQDAYDRGCCGYFDKVVDVAGRQAKVGCNYGH